MRTFQERVRAWVIACFGDTVLCDTKERNWRFLEEALELAQACDCSREDALKLIDYVYGRPVGEKSQEVGGVLLTLSALCSAHGISMDAAGQTELLRCWDKFDAIRAKQAAKQKDSALPGSTQKMFSHEAEKLTREFIDSFKDADDPPGCVGCGAIAGCCKDYPNCPGNPNWRAT